MDFTSAITSPKPVYIFRDPIPFRFWNINRKLFSFLSEISTKSYFPSLSWFWLSKGCIVVWCSVWCNDCCLVAVVVLEIPLACCAVGPDESYRAFDSWWVVWNVLCVSYVICVSYIFCGVSAVDMDLEDFPCDPSGVDGVRLCNVDVLCTVDTTVVETVILVVWGREGQVLVANLDLSDPGMSLALEYPTPLLRLSN